MAMILQSPSNIACIDATPTCSARQALGNYAIKHFFEIGFI